MGGARHREREHRRPRSADAARREVEGQFLDRHRRGSAGAAELDRVDGPLDRFDHLLHQDQGIQFPGLAGRDG